MKSLYQVASKYFNRHIFAVNKDQLYNKFESKLFNYKPITTNNIGTKFVNSINNDPFISLINKVYPSASTTHGFYVSKPFEFCSNSTILVIPFGLAPIHNLWRVRDIVERDKAFAAINMYHNQKKDKNFYLESTYPLMDEHTDPFSTKTSLSDLLKKHVDSQYFKEISDYIKDSDRDFDNILKNVDYVFSLLDDDKKRDLIKQLKLDCDNLKSSFFVEDKYWVSYDGLSSSDFYNQAARFMNCSKHLHVFGKRGLGPSQHCKGGFSMSLQCPLTNAIHNSGNSLIYYQIIKGTGHVFPEQMKPPYVGDSRFPFWGNIYLRESIEDFGVKTVDFPGKVVVDIFPMLSSINNINNLF